MAGADEIAEARVHLEATFSQVVAEDVVARFRRRGAIAAVANFMTHPAETWILLDPDSPLHQEALRARLKEVCQASDPAVPENCLTYLRMLAGGEGSGFTPSALAQDADLIVPLWTAVIRMSPHPRVRQMVTDLAARLRQGLTDPALVPLPSSWAVLGTGTDDANGPGGGSVGAPGESAP